MSIIRGCLFHFSQAGNLTERNVCVVLPGDHFHLSITFLMLLLQIGGAMLGQRLEWTKVRIGCK